MAKYEEISVKDELPTEDGKYIIRTQTKILKKENFMSVSFIAKSGKWGCTNQIVTHWFKEI